MKQRLLFTLLFLALTLPCAARAEDLEAQARELINALGCKGCHPFNGQGGNLAPSLNEVGARLSKEEIRAWLIAPKNQRPDSLMPSFRHVPAEDIEILVRYLAGRRK